MLKSLRLHTAAFVVLLSSGVAQAAPAQATLAPTASAPAASTAPEAWKGEPEPGAFRLGVLSGLGVIDSKAGFALLGTASRRIVRQGFIPDINDSVSIETELGPLFTQGTSAFAYSLHLRWDFTKDDTWTFYAIGGVGGDITGASLGSRFLLFPRFGVGAFYWLNDQVQLRAELSHELIAVGAAVPF